MAKFNLQLPSDIMDDLKKLSNNSDKIFGKMTEEAAKSVAQTVKATAPLPEIAQGVTTTKVYKTPSDDGINTKVIFRGDVPLKGGRMQFTRRGRVGGKKYTTKKGVPIEFLAQVWEYGTSPRYTDTGAYRGYIGKKPYFRKAFKKDQIERIMREVQKRESGGIIDG